MSLIIVEGPDGAGKSTLVEKLAKEMDLSLYRSGGPKDKVTMYKVLGEMKELALSEETYITDRAPWFSEIIYSMGMGRKPVIDLNEFADYWKLPQKVIYCRLADKDEMLANMSRSFKAHKPKEHTDSVIANYSNICLLYDEVIDKAEQWGVDVFEYDWQNTWYDDLLRWM